MSSNVSPTPSSSSGGTPSTDWRALLSQISKGLVGKNKSTYGSSPSEEEDKAISKKAAEEQTAEFVGLHRAVQDSLEVSNRDGLKVNDISGSNDADPSTSVDQVPFIPPPTISVNGVEIKQNVGYLALLGLVLSLLAKANSQSQTQQLNTQNQAIQAQIALAPQIGAAIKAQAEAQSDATMQQAKLSLFQGVVNIMAFAAAGVAGAVGMMSGGNSLGSAAFTQETQAVSGATTSAGSGATSSLINATDDVVGVGSSLDEVDDAAAAANALDDVDDAAAAAAARRPLAATSSLQSQTTQSAASAEGSAASNALDEVSDITNASKNSSSSKAIAQQEEAMSAGRAVEAQRDVATTQNLEQAASIDEVMNNPSWKEKMSRGFAAIKSYGGAGVQKMGAFMDSASKFAMLSNLLVQGVDGIAGFVYQSRIAAAQLREGEAQAISTQLQQMASVYGQLANQAGSAAEQSAQAFTQVLQILINAGDSASSTTSAIFR